MPLSQQCVLYQHKTKTKVDISLQQNNQKKIPRQENRILPVEFSLKTSACFDHLALVYRQHSLEDLTFEWRKKSLYTQISQVLKIAPYKYLQILEAFHFGETIRQQWQLT